MKKTSLFLVLISILFWVVACSSNETLETNIVLPEDIPEFVVESDFDLIDWERKAVEFGDRGIIGNENKSGVIGADMPTLDGQKWLWHLWGVENVELTVVGFHKETETVHQVLFNGPDGEAYWTRNVGSGTNGADSTMPSSVKLPKGEWALLLYSDATLFDILVYDISE